MCDACSQVPCIQMCCPHGEAFVNTDPDDPYQKSCKKNEGDNRYNATFHDNKGEVITSWKRNEHYLFVAPKEGTFECPVEQMPAGSQHFGGKFAAMEHFANPEDFKIVMDGSLKGTMMMFDDHENEDETAEGKTVEVQFKSQEFCVVQTDVESEDNSTNLDFQLFICKFPSPSGTANGSADGSGIGIRIGSQNSDYKCEARMIKVQSSTCIISIVFLLITLIVYMIEPSLQKQYLFSRITISLIVNLTVTFIIIVYIQLSKDPETLYLNNLGGTLGKYKNICKIYQS